MESETSCTNEKLTSFREIINCVAPNLYFTCYQADTASIIFSTSPDIEFLHLR